MNYDENNGGDQPFDEPVQVITESALATITKAEIDIQITTAKAYPRSLSKFLRAAMSYATTNEDVAASCAYALPRKQKNKQTGKMENVIIDGPSVRLAEIVCSAYQNIRTAARVIKNDGKKITAQGLCHDLENNVVSVIEVERRITYATGGTFSEDLQIVTANAAIAIAFRNAVYKVIPAALISDIYEKVKEVAKGTAETLPKRRKARVDFFRQKGITDEQICEVLEVREIDDIDLDKLVILQGMITALKSDGSTLESLFPPKDPAKAKADGLTKQAEDELKRMQEKNNKK